MALALAGANAIVTGGSRGIGRAVASALAHHGVNVAVWSRSLDSADAAAQALQRSWPAAVTPHEPPSSAAATLTHFGVECDVKSLSSIEQALAESEARFGGQPVHILVNAAGVVHNGLLVSTSTANMLNIMETNLIGTMYTCKAVLKSMLRAAKPGAGAADEAAGRPDGGDSTSEASRGRAAPRRPAYAGGCIVSIGSVVGRTGNAGQSVYAASKSGLVGFTKSLSKEMARKGIRVNMVSPGYTHTDMTRAMSATAVANAVARIPLERFGTAEEVAHSVVFLAQSPYITGHELVVDGGLS